MLSLWRDPNPPQGVDIGDLGRTYAVIREIGRGGMGAVLLARHRVAGHFVAIKIASPQALDADSRARLQREARLMASLQHPNIVRLYDVRPISGDRLGIVMEYVRGRTLARILEEQHALPFTLCCSLLGDLGNALAYAHADGIVHRDVKPQNVLVEDDTQCAKLCDFGIARSAGDAAVTMTGSVMGTPAYMSPEQVDGLPLDGRSDIYSLGMLGWEIATGQRPWAGDDLYHVLHKQKHEALPPITVFRPDAPPRLVFALEGALAKDPALRWQSVGEMLAQLEVDEPTAVLQDRRQRATPLRGRRGRVTVDAETVPIFRRRPHAEPVIVAPLPSDPPSEEPRPSADPSPPPAAVPSQGWLERLPDPWKARARFAAGAVAGGLVMLLAGRLLDSTGPATGETETTVTTEPAVPVAAIPEPVQAARLESPRREEPAASRRPIMAERVPVDGPGPSPARARALAYAGKTDAARLIVDSALAVNARDAEAYIVRARVRVARGEVRAAWTDIELAARMGLRWEALALTSSLWARELGQAAARERLRPELQRALTPRRPLDTDQAVGLAAAVAQTGDTATALTLLELARWNPGRAEALSDPLLGPLRRSQRFATLQQRVARR